MMQSVNGVNRRIYIMIYGGFYGTSYKIIP